MGGRWRSTSTYVHHFMTFEGVLGNIFYFLLIFGGDGGLILDLTPWNTN
jgi:hypothetical protein